MSIFFISEEATIAYLRQAICDHDWHMVSFLATLHYVRFGDAN